MYDRLFYLRIFSYDGALLEFINVIFLSLALSSLAVGTSE
jgi:hypothetical protein